MQAPSTDAERRLVMDALAWVVNGMSRIIGPDVELVLHDLSRPEASVMAIANGTISRRTVGSAIFSGPFGDEGLRQLIQGGDRDEPVTVVADYRTTLPDGRQLDSLSLMFRGTDGKAYAALCANADRQRLRQLRDLLDAMLSGTRAPEPAEDPASVEEMARRIIEESIAATGARGEPLGREDRRRAVLAMQARGLFLIRQSVELAAERLGVTRHTIYNDLERRDGDPV